MSDINKILGKTVEEIRTKRNRNNPEYFEFISIDFEDGTSLTLISPANDVNYVVSKRCW